MPEILTTKSIYYKDINLIARPNNIIKSRTEIPKELNRVFVSPMPAIVGARFAEEALELGLQVSLHRFCSIEDQVNLYTTLWCPEYRNRIWAAVGLNDDNRIYELAKRGCHNFIIDVANGYLNTVVKYTTALNKEYRNCRIMVGNIHSAEGIGLYPSCSNLYCRVGIANGSGCDTKTMTAVNRGQVTELLDCCPVAYRHNINVVADGGIVSPSDAVKAFGLGSPYIMMGGYFKTAEEAQNVINGEYKFWGCASKLNQQKYGEVRRHSEGKVLEVNKDEIKPLKELVADLWGGISSGISYSGYGHLTGFIGKGIFETRYI